MVKYEQRMNNDPINEHKYWCWLAKTRLVSEGYFINLAQELQGLMLESQVLELHAVKPGFRINGQKLRHNLDSCFQMQFNSCLAVNHSVQETTINNYVSEQMDK